MVPGSTGSPINAIAPRSGNALNAVLWDTGTGGCIGVTAGLMQVISAALVGTVNVQGSNDDGTTWENVVLTSGAGAAIDSVGTSVSGSQLFSAMFTRMRAIITAWTSGAATAPVIFESGAAIAVRQPLKLYRLPAALASTNPVLVLTGARKLFGGFVYNAAAAARFLKFYDKATAPVVGTDIPILTIAIPATSGLSISQICTDYGIPFALGLGIGLTVNLVDADTTALTAGDVQVELLYS